MNHEFFTDTPTPTRRDPVPRILGGAVILLAVATIAVIVATWPGARPGTTPPGQNLNTVLAQVTSVRAEACSVPDPRGCERAHFKIIEGADQGDTGSLLFSGMNKDATVSAGDRIRVVKTPAENLALETGDIKIEQWSFSDFDRRGPMLWLALFFVAVVLVAGRLKGLRALFGLGLSVAVVLGYLVPGLLNGENSLLIAMAAAFAVMFLTIPLAHGWGLTTIAATLGTAASLGITVGLAVLFTNLTNLTGFGSEDAAYLSATTGDVSIRGLLLAGIVIATLGVLDDVTITQASTVLALRRANPLLGYRQLFVRALSVGRDHITATINTLVLAYAGASLPTLLIFAVADVRVSDALNGENVASQVVGTLVGSIGLIAAVPITTALAALLAAHVRSEDIDPHEGHTHG